MLGSSSSVPRSGRACSSYLIESTKAALVCDLGPGAFANLRRFIGYQQLDAVFITHMHADHFLDLIMLRNALKYGPQRREAKLPVYLPASGERSLHAVASGVGSDTSGDFFEDVFDLRTYQADNTLSVEDYQLNFAQTVHYIDAYAIRVQCNDAVLTYSADTAPCANVVTLARDSNLFVCESTLGPQGRENGSRGHCSAREAALMAQEAHVKELLLTHYGSESSPQRLEQEARRHFQGQCTVADDLMQLTV